MRRERLVDGKKEYVPESPERKQPHSAGPNTGRPTAGDYVTLLENANTRGAGETGKIFQDDHDDRPYRLRFNGYECPGFFREAQVRHATTVMQDSH